jgi:predicted dehydrogenase/threonine dehydrogenase-like Zn-dependent dehydrogenase
MKQVLQNMSSGETRLVDVPTPGVSKTSLLIQTNHSLISVGTERMLVEFGKANLLDKARAQPERVKVVFDKMKTDGVFATLDAVKSKLDQPLPLGYCNVGRVLELGGEVKEFAEGERVVSNGYHASVVSVSRNLAAKIPDAVSDEAAAFTVLASIGLQGIRLATPTLGETFVVTGLGLIGLLTVQLLRAHGCRVLGIDFDEAKLKLAKGFGAEVVHLSRGEKPLESALAFSRGRGVDGVIITASTKSSEPVSEAARMCRKRRRIVLVGVTGLELNRTEFYEKELTFQVSCSYGPGRYDPNYEEKGQDYPLGFVRWTEKRNFEAVLDMMADGRLQTEPLISHRFSFDEAVKAYDVLSNDKAALGIVLNYPDVPQNQLRVSKVTLKPASFNPQEPILGFIGSGNYASRILIPAFKKAGAQLHTIVSSGGVSATHHGERNGFHAVSTESSQVLDDPTINTVVVVTRHNTHAPYVVQALERKKHVFVEKPLALSDEELVEIERAYQRAEPSGVRLMVGFNRRFAPMVVKMKSLLQAVNEPKSLIMTMNVGAIPADNWVQDTTVGGGRIIGEACHYFDLMRFLVGHEVVSVQARRMGKYLGAAVAEDKASITLGFADGSFGTVHYLANGGKAFPKERVEVFAAGAVLQLDNFLKLSSYGWPGFRTLRSFGQDKGQEACAAAFMESLRRGLPAPIPFTELLEVSRITHETVRQLREQK